MSIDPPKADRIREFFLFSKERTIRTQMNTDEHGLKRKFVSPSARKDTYQVSTFVYLAGIPPPGGLY
jgi:hypothetical protein